MRAAVRARWPQASATGLLGALPRPGGARRGWPWTTESAPPPPLRPDGRAWPRISIVTPSYNQGCFLEETIRSVLLQNYPNLEYRIVDGGSVDGSVAIIKSYGSLLSGWVSEPDHGQAAAIEKGFRTATGDLLFWLNSDDYLLPGALFRVAQQFIAEPRLEWAVGGGVVVDEQGRQIEKRYAFPQQFESLLFLGQFFMQMSAFWTRDAHRGVGGLDEGLHFCFDYDFFLKLARRSAPGRINALLSAFRLHDASKTSTIFQETAVPECRLVRERYGYEAWPEAVRQHKEAVQRRSFHLNKRRGELQGAFSDPRYFGRQVLRYLGGAANQLLARIRHFGFRIMSRRFIFTRIYRQGGFAGPQVPRSGTGSTVTQTEETRRIIEEVLLRYGVRVLVDAPCGDFTWMRQVSLRDVTYIGVDIVEDVVASNTQKYADERRIFRELDIVRQSPPKGDLILSRDCFVHLSNSDIQKALGNFALSGGTYLLTTTFPSLTANIDMVSGRGWRPVNLERSPFCLPAPLEIFNEKCSENDGRHADKSLGLWSLASVRSTNDGRNRD